MLEQELWAQLGAGPQDSLALHFSLQEGQSRALLGGGFQIGAMMPQGANSCISKGVALTSFTKGKTCVHRWAPSCPLKGGGSQPYW